MGLGVACNTNAELVSAARAQIADWARTRLAHRRHPARRARREAIGLPRFSDPLRTLLGAATAAATQMPPTG